MVDLTIHVVPMNLSNRRIFFIDPSPDQLNFSGLHKLFSPTALRPQFLQKNFAGLISLIKLSVFDSIYPSSCSAHRVFSSVSLIVCSFLSFLFNIDIARVSLDNNLFHTAVHFIIGNCIPVFNLIDRTQVFVAEFILYHKISFIINRGHCDSP